jgi:hypothetical protein
MCSLADTASCQWIATFLGAARPNRIRCASRRWAASHGIRSRRKIELICQRALHFALFTCLARRMGMAEKTARDHRDELQDKVGEPFDTIVRHVTGHIGGAPTWGA